VAFEEVAMSIPRRHHVYNAEIPEEANWLDRAVGEARRRGDFDDLPGRGEPIRLNPEQPDNEWELAFSILKNAGYVPYWVELGKEIDIATAALPAARQQARDAIQALLARVGTPAEPAPAHERRSFRFFRRPAPHQPSVDESLRLSGVEAERVRLRSAYLDRIDELNAKIQEYHRALPDDLWRLQRPRPAREEMAAEFDRDCPPVGSEHAFIPFPVS
jgi:hypothetical protein